MLPNTEPTVFVVDDDEGVRDSLSMLIDADGLRVEAYGSACAFLDQYQAARPGCLILDMRLPDLGGLDLLERLADRNSLLPVIILTGHGDVPAAVHAMKVGAMDFIEKPFNARQLLDRIRQAIDHDRRRRSESAGDAALSARIALLTPREREIMEMIVGGKANKVIAIELDISERTVELHRSRMMKKMQVRSLAELIHVAAPPRGSRGVRGDQSRERDG